MPILANLLNGIQSAFNQVVERTGYYYCVWLWLPNIRQPLTTTLCVKEINVLN